MTTWALYVERKMPSGYSSHLVPITADRQYLPPGTYYLQNTTAEPSPKKTKRIPTFALPNSVSDKLVAGSSPALPARPEVALSPKNPLREHAVYRSAVFMPRSSQNAATRARSLVNENQDQCFPAPDQVTNPESTRLVQGLSINTPAPASLPMPCPPQPAYQSSGQQSLFESVDCNDGLGKAFVRRKPVSSQCSIRRPIRSTTAESSSASASGFVIPRKPLANGSHIQPAPKPLALSAPSPKHFIIGPDMLDAL